MGIFRKKIGLALGSGASKGIAHVGVLKELERNNINIDYISGTSIGGLVGAIYAVTKNPYLIEDICVSATFNDVLRAFSDVNLKEGLILGDKIFDIFGQYIPENMLIQDTQIPLNLVASDLETGERYVFKEGRLRDAIRASISIPVVFKPVRYKGMVLVDGGLTEPVPVKTVKDMGAERVIGVNLYSGVFPRKLFNKKLSTADIAAKSVDVSLQELSRRDLELADVGIDIPIGEKPLMAFTDNPKELIQIGEEETKRHMGEIKVL